MIRTNTIPVDGSNCDQLAAWDGDEGAYWAAHAEYFDRSVVDYHRRLLGAAAITANDRVLLHAPPSPDRHWAWTSRPGCWSTPGTGRPKTA
jgi:hypothetical protein